MHGAIAEKPWMAIPKQIAIITMRLLNKIKCSRLCALDPGNPCRDDGVTQTLVYNGERFGMKMPLWTLQRPVYKCFGYGLAPATLERCCLHSHAGAWER
ncbi:MAG: hypothetical protein WAW41_18880 [Methylobacter sp.]